MQEDIKVGCLDIETDSLDASKVWCVVTRDLNSSPHKVWLEPFEGLQEYLDGFDYWVAHNGLNFDFPVMAKLLGVTVPFEKIIDTFVVSRTVNYSGYATHGLDEIGLSLGLRKIPFHDFSQLTPEMITYCKRDVDVNIKVYQKYKRYIHSEDWKVALEVEHKVALICEDMHSNGFSFDRGKAEELLSSIHLRMSELESSFQTQWPPALTEVNRLKYRVKADGTYYKTVLDAFDKYPKTEVDGDELVCFEYVPFNPGSPADRVRKLWEAEWKPTEMTKTHYEWTKSARVGGNWRKQPITSSFYKEKNDHFKTYGWTVSEENLLTLPDTAPEATKQLAEWLSLEGRRSSLVEWLGRCGVDGRIHGKFWHIGTWTGRMSHSAPNSANIASVFHGDPSNPVELVKSTYDGQLRKLWGVSPENYLVGTDAEGIQLRILAHYLQSEEYIHAIVSGKKEDETDIHNVNKRALGLNHIGRDDAKTFIYAHVLGAGLAKTSRILRTGMTQTKKAVGDFQERLGLSKLRKGLIHRDAMRGFFDGLDGRKVLCNSEHLMLAGYLQNGEAVVMKHANVLWREKADEAGLKYKQVNFVHDEWQTESIGSLDAAENLAQIQRESIKTVGERLGIICPLAGSSSVGKNWFDTH